MEKNHLVKNIYRQLFAPPFKEYIKAELNNCNTILDLGCGKGSSVIQYFNEISYSVGVEVFKNYLIKSKEKSTHTEYILGDIRQIEFKPDSFDVVVALSVLEHLTKDEGIKLLRKMENWATKKVIVLVPNGFLPQDEFDGNFFQIHKSGWFVDDFKDLGFNVYGVAGLRYLRREMGKLRQPNFLWKVISDLTQKITYKNPSFAFELLAIKYLKVNENPKNKIEEDKNE